MEAFIKLDKATIYLGNSLKIFQIAEQKKIYLQALATNNAISLAGDQLTSLDTASLQLLLSFVMTAKQHNISIQWLNASPELLHASKLLGLQGPLDLHSFSQN